MKQGKAEMEMMNSEMCMDSIEDLQELDEMEDLA